MTKDDLEAIAVLSVILLVVGGVLWGVWWFACWLGGGVITLYIIGIIIGGLLGYIIKTIFDSSLQERYNNLINTHNQLVSLYNECKNDAERYRRNKKLGAKLKG